MSQKNSNSKKATGKILLCLFFLSAFLHLCYLIELQKTPYATLLLVDAEGYHQKAMKLIREGWLGDGTFFQAPLYPYFLALVYKIFNSSFLVVQSIQILLSCFTPILIYFIGKCLFNERVGLVSTAIAVFYGVFIFYSGLLLKVTLSLFSSSLLILFLLRANRIPTKGNYFVVGLCLGVNILLRGNFLLLVPALFLAMIFFSPLARSKFHQALVFLLGVSLLVAPVTIRNFYLEQDFVLTSYDAGPSFYIGNHPRATGFQTHLPFVRPNPLYEELDFRAEAERKSGTPLKPSQVSKFWFVESFNFFRDDPAAFLKIVVKKFLLFFNNYEIPDNYDFAFMKSLTPALKLGFIPFGALLVFSTLAVFLYRWNNSDFWIVYIYGLVYSLSVIMFYVTSRFRVPLVPVLIPLAAFFVMEGWNKIRELKGSRLAVFIAVFISVSFIAFRPFSITDFAFSQLKIGIDYEEKGMLAEAEAQYLKALEINPRYSKAHFHLASAYKKSGRAEEALKEINTALNLNPNFAKAHYLKGLILFGTGVAEASISAFKEALKIQPNFAEARYYLGVHYFRKGLIDQAVNETRLAVKLKPKFSEAHFNLGGLFKLLNKTDRAIIHYQQALEQGYPVDPEILRSLKLTNQ
ncbi:MAG: DUF6427 family protein [Nitrospinota bacterium]|nr:DUF6427 family protein [Nitrospinota bacterium]